MTKIFTGAQISAIADLLAEEDFIPFKGPKSERKIYKKLLTKLDASMYKALSDQERTDLLSGEINIERAIKITLEDNYADVLKYIDIPGVPDVIIQWVMTILIRFLIDVVAGYSSLDEALTDIIVNKEITLSDAIEAAAESSE